jgi:hypothetical protein
LSSNGLWLIDLGLSTPQLAPGQSTIVQTIVIENPLLQRASLGHGIYALPYPNAAPIFSSTPVTAAEVGQPYQYDANATDPDGSFVAYIVVSGPEGMSVDGAGLLSWLPAAGTPSQVHVSLRAYDARLGSATQTFTIDVAGGNRAPMIASVQTEYQLTEGVSFQLPLDAIDPDGQPIAFVMDHLPPGAIFDSAGRVFEWTPSFLQSGIYRDVRIIANDGSLSTEVSVDFVVNPANAPPILTGVPPRTVREGDPIRVNFDALDFDGDTIEFESPNLPTGAFLDLNTGVFEWTPGFAQAGSYSIAIWANDGFVRTETTLAITVTNVNAAPVFDDLSGIAVFENQSILFRAFAFDPDNPEFAIQDRLADGTLTELQSTAPTVTYTAANLPSTATFDPITAILKWTPGFTDAGNYVFHFIATDDGNGTGTPLSTTSDVAILVRNANRAPVLPDLNTVHVSKGATLDIPIVAIDPDGNPLVFTTVNLPRFATFVGHPDGTALLRLTPGDNDRGDTVITITATDDGDGGGTKARLSASRTFDISSDSSEIK